MVRRHEIFFRLILFSLSRIICRFFVFCCRDLERDLSLSEDSEDEASKVKKKKEKDRIIRSFDISFRVIIIGRFKLIFCIDNNYWRKLV